MKLFLEVTAALTKRNSNLGVFLSKNIRAGSGKIAHIELFLGRNILSILFSSWHFFYVESFRNTFWKYMILIRICGLFKQCLSHNQYWHSFSHMLNYKQLFLKEWNYTIYEAKSKKPSFSCLGASKCLTNVFGKTQVYFEKFGMTFFLLQRNATYFKYLLSLA